MYTMFATIVQHELAKKLVGVELKESIAYSLKITNAAPKRIMEILLDEEHRIELALTKHTIKINGGIQILGENRTHNTRIEIKEGVEKNELFVNILYYYIHKNMVKNRLKSWSDGKFVYLKYLFNNAEPPIRFVELNPEHRINFLLESVESHYKGSYMELIELLKISKIKTILFTIGVLVIIGLFWSGETEAGITGFLTVIMYFIFEVTRYSKRTNPESVTF